MSLPSEHMGDLLVTKGFIWGDAVSGSTDWRVWIGKQPDKPDRTVTIYDTGGKANNPRWLLDYPSVQVRVRGGPSDYREAHLKATQTRDCLLGIPSYTAGNGDRIVHVNAIGDVAFTGWDQNQRCEFVFNLSLIIEPTTNASTNRDPL